MTQQSAGKDAPLEVEPWPLWKKIAVLFLAVTTLAALLGTLVQAYQLYVATHKSSQQAAQEPVPAPASQAPVQPSFRDRYNALAKVTAPAFAIRECVTTKSAGRNRDTLITCRLVADGAQLMVSGLNNRFTGTILEVDVPQLENSGDLMKAGRVFLRLARGKDAESEDSLEMTQMVIEAQQHPGQGACEDTPEQHTRFCVTTVDKKIYHFGIVDPEMWK